MKKFILDLRFLLSRRATNTETLPRTIITNSTHSKTNCSVCNSKQRKILVIIQYLQRIVIVTNLNVHAHLEYLRISFLPASLSWEVYHFHKPRRSSNDINVNLYPCNFYAVQFWNNCFKLTKTFRNNNESFRLLWE